MRTIRYPSGLEVTVGDLVWWNEGRCVGIIVGVYSDLEARSQLGIEGPCVEISNELSSPRKGGNGIFYPASSLADDGIEKLTSSEALEVRRIVESEEMRDRNLVTLTTISNAFSLDARNYSNPRFQVKSQKKEPGG